MKVEELMIGDLVYYSYPNPFVTKVIDVCSHGEEHFIRCKRDEKDNLYKQDQLEDFNVGILKPIPLTPEILEKNGFKKPENNCNYIIHNTLIFNDFTLALCTYDYNSITPYNHICYCRYVHELQHVLKLCGINKKIIV